MSQTTYFFFLSFVSQKVPFENEIETLPDLNLSFVKVSLTWGANILSYSTSFLQLVVYTQYQSRKIVASWVFKGFCVCVWAQQTHTITYALGVYTRKLSTSFDCKATCNQGRWIERVEQTLSEDAFLRKYHSR